MMFNGKVVDVLPLSGNWDFTHIYCFGEYLIYSWVYAQNVPKISKKCIKKHDDSTLDMGGTLLVPYIFGQIHMFAFS